MDRIKIELVRSKRRSISLEVKESSVVVVRAPLRLSIKQIENVIAKKKRWIERAAAKMKQRELFNLPKKFEAGEDFFYLGNRYELSLIEGRSKKIFFESGFYLPRGAARSAKQLFTAWYKKQAREVITKRIIHYATRYGFKYNKIKISSAEKRWGSCSSRSNLNFSWRLIMAPLAVVDYVIVHELVHIKVPNHSKKFWETVGKIYPDYRECKKWLRENGHALIL